MKRSERAAVVSLGNQYTQGKRCTLMNFLLYAEITQLATDTMKPVQVFIHKSNKNAVNPVFGLNRYFTRVHKTKD